MGTRAHWVEHLTDRKGNVLDGATVYVYDQGTTTPISETIYQYDSDHASAANTLSNPLTADASGKVEFFLAAVKRCDIVVSYGGMSDYRRTIDVGTGGAGPPGADGVDGADGAVWHNGSGAPAGATGAVGDYYIDNDTGDYYEKTGASAWTLRGNLEGPTGPAGGGANALNDLTDVDTTGLADNNILVYDQATSLWKPEAPSSGGASALDDLTDVTITAAASGDFLRHNGTAWVDATIADADIPATIARDAEVAAAYQALSAYDAKGDILAASAADTSSRLPVGSNGLALVADSAESTGLEWAAVGRLLDYTVYKPVDTTLQTTSTSFVDLDATNLTVSFVAPASGIVLVRLTAAGVLTGGAGNQDWNLRDGSGDISGTAERAFGALGSICRTSAAIIKTGLTPGTTYTWKWGYKATANTAQVFVGTTYGSAVMEVWECPA